jgi:hypothetical protein
MMVLIICGCFAAKQVQGAPYIAILEAFCPASLFYQECRDFGILAGREWLEIFDLSFLNHIIYIIFRLIQASHYINIGNFYECPEKKNAYMN